jgi:hypothetical protein
MNARAYAIYLIVVGVGALVVLAARIFKDVRLTRICSQAIESILSKGK